MNTKKIIIVGGECSGRHELLNKFTNKIFNSRGYFYCTIPKKENEIFTDFYFMKEIDFKGFTNNNLILFSHSFIFNNKQHFYGILKKDWEYYNTFIFNVRDVLKISKEDRKNCLVIYLNISRVTRCKRLEEKYQNNKELIKSKLESDDFDFGIYGERFFDFDISIKNSDF